MNIHYLFERGGFLAGIQYEEALTKSAWKGDSEVHVFLQISKVD